MSCTFHVHGCKNPENEKTSRASNVSVFKVSKRISDHLSVYAAEMIAIAFALQVQHGANTVKCLSLGLSQN